MEENYESSYTGRTLLGHWQDSFWLAEEKMARFLKKRERGELLVQRTRRMMANLLKETTLSFPSKGYVEFGSVVQLICPLVRSPGRTNRCGVSLSCLITEGEVDSTQHLVACCTISGSSLLTPCVRNTFIIISDEGPKSDGQPLRYGETFLLIPTETQDNQQLYVTVDPPGPGPLSSKVFLQDYVSSYSRWRALYKAGAYRFETEGMPVTANDFVVINHVPTNHNLTVISRPEFNTFFGVECGITVRTKLDSFRREEVENCWIITMQKPEDKRTEHVELPCIPIPDNSCPVSSQGKTKIDPDLEAFLGPSVTKPHEKTEEVCLREQKQIIDIVDPSTDHVRASLHPTATCNKGFRASNPTSAFPSDICTPKPVVTAPRRAEMPQESGTQSQYPPGQGPSMLSVFGESPYPPAFKPRQAAPDKPFPVCPEYCPPVYPQPDSSCPLMNDMPEPHGEPCPPHVSNEENVRQGIN